VQGAADVDSSDVALHTPAEKKPKRFMFDDTVVSELLKAVQVINPFGVPHGQTLPAWEQVAAAVRNAGHDGASGRNCEEKLKKLLKDFDEERKLQRQKTGVEAASGKHDADLETVAQLRDKAIQDKTEKKESKTAKEQQEQQEIADIRGAMVNGMVKVTPNAPVSASPSVASESESPEGKTLKGRKQQTTAWMEQVLESQKVKDIRDQELQQREQELRLKDQELRLKDQELRLKDQELERNKQALAARKLALDEERAAQESQRIQQHNHLMDSVMQLLARSVSHNKD